MFAFAPCSGVQCAARRMSASTGGAPRSDRSVSPIEPSGVARSGRRPKEYSVQSDPKRPPSPAQKPAPVASAPAAPGKGSRAFTGMIVTLLLLALVALIVVTLLRFPVREADNATPAAVVVIAPTATLPADLPAETPPTAAVAASNPVTESAPVIDETAPTAVEPTPAADAAPTAAPAAVPAAVVEPTPSGPLPLPTPDPAAPPLPAFQLFANANSVNDVALEGGVLWTATSGGPLRWDIATGSSTTFTAADGMIPGPLTAVVPCAMEGFGTVFGGNNGLQIYSAADNSWKQIVSGGSAIAWNDVAALACDADQGILAVGYAAHGVDVYRQRTARWSHTEPADGLFTHGATAVAVGPGGVVWAASGGSLVQIQGTRTSTFSSDNSPLSGEEITALRTDADGALWVTAGNRVHRFADDAWESYTRRADVDFPTGKLVDVAPSQSGRAWLLSEDAEVCRFDPEFESCAPFYVGAEGMAAAPATALDADASGVVAYGTAGQGSSVQTGGQWSTLAQPAGFPASNRIFALASDARGFLWVATTAGVQQADPARPTEIAYRYSAAKDGVSATNVRALFADPRGGVWLGGIGASYFDGKRWTNYTQADGLAGDEITAIAEDSQGRVWFGTGTGLSIWTGTTFFNLTSENGLPDSEILALAADGPGMWIGSANGGLYRFENNQLQVLTEANVGLPSDRVTALLVLEDGTTLVGTDAGLARFADGAVSSIDDLPATRITALAAAPGGGVWAGTADAGVYFAADGKTFAPFTPPDGGPIAQAVQRDDGGWLRRRVDWRRQRRAGTRRGTRQLITE